VWRKRNRRNSKKKSRREKNKKMRKARKRERTGKGTTKPEKQRGKKQSDQQQQGRTEEEQKMIGNRTFPTVTPHFFASAAISPFNTSRNCLRMGSFLAHCAMLALNSFNRAKPSRVNDSTSPVSARPPTYALRFGLAIQYQGGRRCGGTVNSAWAGGRRWRNWATVSFVRRAPGRVW
jgi:hypothetical protein